MSQKDTRAVTPALAPGASVASGAIANAAKRQSYKEAISQEIRYLLSGNEIASSVVAFLATLAHARSAGVTENQFLDDL